MLHKGRNHLFCSSAQPSHTVASFNLLNFLPQEAQLEVENKIRVDIYIVSNFRLSWSTVCLISVASFFQCISRKKGAARDLVYRHFDQSIPCFLFVSASIPWNGLSDVKELQS